MLVADLLRALKTKETESLSDAERQALNDFFAILARHGEMDLGAFLDLFKPKRRRTGATAGGSTTRTPKVSVSVQEVVDALAKSFNDDDAFEKKLKEFAALKALTKPMLKNVFMQLFEADGGVPSKATRDELVRLIADERNIVVRDRKAGAMLGRRPVTAE